MPLSNVVKAKGLYTFGNELDTVEGSQVIADNVNIDETGTITPRRGFKDIGYSPVSQLIRMKQLLHYKKTPIRHYNDILEFERNGEFYPFDGSYNQVDEDIRIKYQEASSNLYFTTDQGIKKISARSASEFTTDSGYITNAGVPKALDIYANVQYSSTGWLPPQSKVAYKILYGYKDHNNNLLLGTPSARFVVTNTSEDLFVYEKTNATFKEDENYLVQKTSIYCSNRNDTQETSGNDSYLLIDTANNENKYIIWFNQGISPLAPSISGYTNIEVDLTSLASGDNVAPKIVETLDAVTSLEGFTYTLNGERIIFENTSPGVSLGVRSPNNDVSTDIGPGWSENTDVTGTDSKYIQKYFIVNTVNNSYCVYWGNTQTIDQPPTDPSVISKTMIPVQISNTASKLNIANLTTQALINNISTLTFVLNGSGVNPLLTITDTVGGNLPDVEQGSISSSVMEVTIVQQGSITQGERANVELKFIVPSGIDENFFYQVYRTPYITVTEGLTLADIDPGEESYLVIEEVVTGGAGTEITVLDQTPETFRQQGTPLYNNPVSGQGILQTNDVPPIAKDIYFYKNYMFYANTSTYHRYNLNFISLDSFNNPSTTSLVISNKEIVRNYMFRGLPHITLLTTGTKANTLETKNNNDSTIKIYSARDEITYVIWFDKGEGEQPSEVNTIAVRINIADLDDSDQVGPVLYDRLLLLGAFDIELSNDNELLIYNIENGESSDTDTPNSTPSTDIGTGWDIINIQPGEGEDASNNIVLLDGHPSVSINLDLTARSLVNVINKDIDSPVNAYYVSGANDLPGKILLESKSVADDEFYVAIKNADGTAFNPELPTIETGFSTVTPNGDTTILTKVAHDFVDGESVYINCPNCTPAIHDKYTVTVLDVDNISINQTIISGDGTNSYYFFPFEVSDNLSISNRIYYSKLNQPEAVPIVNYMDIGTRDEPIERILALRDNLFVLKTDGIYMLSGYNPPFTVRYLDTEAIACPDSAAILNNQIFMLSTNSIISINESSPSIVSRMIEDQLWAILNEGYDFRKIGFGVGYEDDRAYLLWLPTRKTDTVGTQCFRYNILERTWTRWTKTATCGVVTGISPRLYIGDGDRPTTMIERKNRNRTDFADKDFPLFLPLDAINGDKYRLSDTSEIEIGDVITQTQYVNVPFYNRLLQKLDLDQGLDDTDYFSSLRCETGDNLASRLSDLNTKLIADDSSNTITSHIFNNSDWEAMQLVFNDLISELNNEMCDTSLKDYKTSTGSTTFEYIITNVYPQTNEVKFYKETLLLEGNLTAYKSIDSKVQYNPIHFGDPSVFKQISMGYVMFDQNNFYKARVEYSTDVSPSFVGHDFFMKGTGYWDFGNWSQNETSYWGGSGNDVPRRVIIPRNKQRCRYINVKFLHKVAREDFRIVGIAHEVRSYSNRAYR